MLIAVAVLAALALAATAVNADGAAAAGAPPAGFYESARLEPAASWVAGKKVVVWCAKTTAAFAAAEAERNGNPESAGFPDAIGGSAASFPGVVCADMLAWLNHRHVDDYLFAGAALGLAHEASHLAGLSDEGATDCRALAKLPAMIRRFFPLKRHDATLSLLMLYARDIHAQKPEAYAGSC